MGCNSSAQRKCVLRLSNRRALPTLQNLNFALPLQCNHTLFLSTKSVSKNIPRYQRCSWHEHNNCRNPKMLKKSYLWYIIKWIGISVVYAPKHIILEWFTQSIAWEGLVKCVWKKKHNIYTLSKNNLYIALSTLY